MGANRFIIGGFVMLVVVGFLLVFAGIGRTAEPSSLEEFAKCLSEKGAKMYGAYWCGHCQEQKQAFGNASKFIDYVECDPEGENAKPYLCQQAGIQGYPTWIIYGQVLVGEQSFLTLSQASGCSLA